MFSVTFQTGTEFRKSEHTIEVIEDGGEFVIKTSTKILSHRNPGIVGRVMTNTMQKRYKTEHWATNQAQNLFADYQKSRGVKE